jgi:hypothetical protein
MGDESLSSAWQWRKTGRERKMPMFSFARSTLPWLAAAAFKAQDELAALGLDSRLAVGAVIC